MRHLKSGKKLGRTSSHRKALYSSLATALFEHKKIHTTEAKAKALRPFAEKLITKAKIALSREKQGLLSEGQSIDVHSRREVGRIIKNKAVLQELFDTIAPTVADRQGGYTRIVKTGFRLGDAGSQAIIELVDWSNPQEGVSRKPKKKKAAPKPESKPVDTVGEVKEEELPESAADVDANADVETKPEAIAETVTEETVEPTEDKTESKQEAASEEKAEEDSTEKEISATEEVEHVEETMKDDSQPEEKQETTPEAQKAPEDEKTSDEKSDDEDDEKKS